MRLPGLCLFCPNIVPLLVIDMFLGFLSYTNEAIIEDQLDVSDLNSSVIETLENTFGKKSSSLIGSLIKRRKFRTFIS